MTAPAPNALQPSNTTQAQASTATQVSLTVASLALPGIGEEAAASTGAAAATEAAAAPSFVFFSGAGSMDAATTWSAANNGIMIGMTEFGQAAENGTMTWAEASEAFANSASGQVHVFSNDPITDYGNIWYQNELPALGSNPNVTGLSIHSVPTP
jgi:hypothetical protein